MRNKKRGSLANIKFVLVVFITSLLLIAGVKLYEKTIILQSPPIEVSTDPVEYTFYRKPALPLPPEKDKSNKVPQDLGDGMIGIPELNIKFKLSEKLRGLVYYPNDLNGHKYVGFSTAILSNSNENCVASRSPIGIMGKTEDWELKEDEGDQHAWVFDRKLMEKYSKMSLENGFTQPPYVIKVDSFYIYFEGPQATCSVPYNESLSNLQFSLVASLQRVMSTVEKLK